jgi:diacylglycerol kinase family enzyme
MLIILNAGARGMAGNPCKTRVKIAELFRTAGTHPQIIVAQGNEVAEIARRAVAGNEETIVAGGGDGTVGTVAGEIAATGTKLGVLPLGTFNHFARDLGVTLHLEGAVHVVVDNHTVRVDVAEVNGRTFVNNSGLGIYPHIVALREAEQQHWLKREKWWALVLATLQVARRLQFLDVRIIGRGKELVRKTSFIFIGNNEYQMTGFQIGRRSRLNAGLLSLYVTHRTGWPGLLRLATAALFRRLNQAKNFEKYSVEEVFIESPSSPVLVATDGEVNWMESPLHYRVRPNALRVIAPDHRTN